MPDSTGFIDRHSWITVIIIFSALFVPLMLREWVSLNAEGMHNVEWHTTSMAKLLQQDLGAHRSLAATLSDLKSPQKFDEFDLHVKQKIGHMGLLNVTIYDASGEVVYAVKDDLVGKIFLLGDSRKAAFNGEVVSELIDRDEYFNEYSQEVNTDLAEVYLPIFSGNGEVSYLLEAYYDYAPIMLRTRSLLLESALSLLATILLAMALLVYLYRGRQRMGQRVKALEAILPICMYCKRIHLKGDNQPEEWMDIESYFAREDDLSFSHGICNDCLQKHYPGSKAAKRVVKKA